MANLGSQINVADIPERDEFQPLPAGKYTMMIVNSEMKETSTGGEMLVLEMDVQDGEYKGRKIFERLNLKNANTTAVDIAFRALGELCRAIGKAKVSDSVELHNKRFIADVAVTPPKGEYGPGNRIKKYISMTEATAAKPAASAELDDEIPF
ncbi:DUF669 domain-containing protein [Rufibacter sediminis]|uniref:DUF669 domain-containing protein n=1 Tax=Rufibacter sediminis TaxID=2762756 RepID=A0ABR6VUQ3_9BACT|nr:DUF669 domain-containing protein [Rufibacter sediminis]MBC3540639.1 DUF669 domain-containing protein [Rufibacter sediminis]